MKRYLMQQPRALENLATDRLGEWIAFQLRRLSSPLYEIHQHDAATAEDLLSRQIETIRHHLQSKLPYKFHNKLGTVLTSAEFVRSNFRSYYTLDILKWEKHVFGRMIETIFTNNLTCLSLHFEYFFASLSSKSYMLSGLIDLTLSPDYYHSFITYNDSDTIQLLKELHNLRYITLNDDGLLVSCIDNILRCIAENCKLLEELNLSNKTYLNDDSINILIQLQNLKRVNLFGTAVTEKGIATLLMSCENIENIETGGNEVALALEYITSFEENAGKEFKLNFYENNDLITLRQLQTIIKTCPQIQKMRLYDEVISINNLRLLNDLQNLCELELGYFDFYEHQITELLQVRGSNLVQLQLYGIDKIDFNALMCICQMCPNVQTLTIQQCIFAKQSVMNDLLSTKNIALKGLTFRNLKRLSLKWEDNGDDEVPISVPTDEQLFFLLSSCPNVEYISTRLVSLPDDFMLRVLDRNPLVSLKQWTFYSRDLHYVNLDNERFSMFVINRIVKYCINSPEFVIYPGYHS